MPSAPWQKSSYCADSSNCLSLAASPDKTIRIRESEAPHTVVTTTPSQLASLMDAIKTGTLTPHPTSL
ncbi:MULTISPECIES: DUF397 domain-containing protein [Streptomyces]|uniref:DUF397 domain-containing protein n=2 Tax=Streptomyces rimosus subsp. rimosus TaxID=132474 RepID=A0A8A1UQ72_STRR1|nr:MULTISPECIES: DUF397 domain-containing protein [Streptomyces]MYT45777.1 DUF397 domain-containing protein [Streptomyces sp. SID5471]QDA05945.1 DUF397 domain-containing protein [Streptomyces rimosus]QEV77219.1 DUF397 domain-containing protein [Streptomyces rimosus]QGY65105.1 DUF397 domain-containing protein [Streptomyces rimosus R6-500]QST82038.1 DUF397 domain-containing protein [Streptomyces rimosus subsp. rimosus ATCC 10970]